MTWTPPEPVAHMIVFNGKCMGFVPTKEELTTPTFTLEQLLAVRNEVLEETAKVCQDASADLRAHPLQRIAASRCATVIRAMKEQK